MASGRGTDLGPEVLLSGSPIGPDLPDAAAPGRRFRLTHHDDHVEWQRGRSVQRWTLPDQKHADGLPTLASVIRAEIGATGRRPRVMLILTADDGTVLARITEGSRERVNGAWQDAAFNRLIDHDVSLQRVSYRDARSLGAAHPGGPPRNSAPWAWMSRRKRS